jgi:AraC family transcriptional regulator
MDDFLVINMALTSRPAHTRVDRMPAANNPLAGEAGRLLIMIPGVPYHLVAPSGTFRSLHCAISCAKFEAIAGEPIDWLALGPFGGEARAGLGIEAHLARIHDELVHSRIGREAAIEACIAMICIDLSRQFRRGAPTRPDVHTGGLAAWRIRTILGRIHSEGPAPRIAELAGLCGLTERQLSRAFKAETGTTIGRFVDEVTVERAHRLLTTTSLSVAEIARELGFASADSFAQSFRRMTGAPPSRSRQR